MTCRICGYVNDWVSRCPFRDLPSHGKTKKEHEKLKAESEAKQRAAEQGVEPDGEDAAG